MTIPPPPSGPPYTATLCHTLAPPPPYNPLGLVDPKTVDISVGGEKASVVTMSKARTKTAKQPKKARHTVLLKKDVRAMIKAVGKS